MADDGRAEGGPPCRCNHVDSSSPRPRPSACLGRGSSRGCHPCPYFGRSRVLEMTESGIREGFTTLLGAWILQLGVLSGERRLLVLGDGAAWIRAWFESLGISLQAMILCWWHLRKRCSESMSSAGGRQGSPPRVRERAAGAVVGREGERGDRTSEGGIGVGEEPCCGRGTHRVPREAASVHSQLPATATGGVMDRQHTGGEIQ